MCSRHSFDEFNDPSGADGEAQSISSSGIGHRGQLATGLARDESSNLSIENTFTSNGSPFESGLGSFNYNPDAPDTLDSIRPMMDECYRDQVNSEMAIFEEGV